MPIPVQALAVSLAAVVALMLILWLASLLLHNASIVDIFWGPGFVVACLAASAEVGRASPRAVLALSLVVVWAARLGTHIYLRNRGQGEDFRYRSMRRRAGRSFAWRSLFEVFLLQALLLWLVSHPLQVVMTASEAGRLGGLDAAALGVWLIGFAFETISDLQLTRFRAEPTNRGRVLRTGLWGWTRHPNYFGEALIAWGLYLLAVGVDGGWVTIYAPALMTFLLVRVSGVGLLERTLSQSKPGYREYMEEVSAFLPLPPRRRVGSP
jgi:steroid 5-alpha reductase family enzyme